MKGPIEYIKEAYKLYTKKENFYFFAKIMAVLTLLSSIPLIVDTYFPGYTSLQNITAEDITDINILVQVSVVVLVFGLMGLWINTTTYMSILNLGKKEKEIFKLGFKKMWKFLLVSIVVGLIVGFGTLLLIIPGVIFGIWYGFSALLVLDKNLSIGSALKESKLMVKGKMLKVFGRSIVFGLLTFLISLIVTAVPYAGSIIVSFISPLFLLPFVLLYKDLSVSN